MCIADIINRGDNILAEFNYVVGADHMPDIIGLKEFSGLWVWGIPYIFGIIEVILRGYSFVDIIIAKEMLQFWFIDR